MYPNSTGAPLPPRHALCFANMSCERTPPITDGPQLIQQMDVVCEPATVIQRGCRKNGEEPLLRVKYYHVPGRPEAVGIWPLDFVGAQGSPQPPRGVRRLLPGDSCTGDRDALQQQLSCNRHLPSVESLCSTLNMQYSRAGSSSSQELGTPGKGCVCSSSELHASFQKQPLLSWATVASSIRLQQEAEAFCEWKESEDEASVLIN